MAEHSRFEVHLTGPARRDMAAILKRGRKEFAKPLRYVTKLSWHKATRDVGDDPDRPGSRPEIMPEGARTYHRAGHARRSRGISSLSPVTKGVTEAYERMSVSE